MCRRRSTTLRLRLRSTAGGMRGRCTQVSCSHSVVVGRANLRLVVEGSRQILFGLHSRIGLDFGILIAWGAVNTAFFPFCCYFMRWKKQKGVTEYWES